MISMIDELKKSELSDEELEMVVGGVSSETEISDGFLPTAGWICTLSGECNNSGKSCNPF